MKKLILLILFCSLLLLTFVGCNDSTTSGNTPLASTPDGTTDETTPDSINSTEPIKSVIPSPSGSNPFGEGPSAFVAELFAQTSNLSSGSSFDITVENSRIYLSDFLYESIGIITTYEASYSDGLLWTLEIEKENSEIEETRKNAEKKLAVLEEIKTCTFCYVIETQTDAKFGKKIAVFYINGEYYLLNAVDEDVTRVWHVQLEQE